MTPRRALWLLILVSATLRLIWAAALGVGNDEAYHYLFTTHRDWSYFDHPPMLALVAALGIKAAGGVVAPITLRLGFVALFAGSTWLMARLTKRFFGAQAGFLAALALNVSAYYTAAAGAFALPDGPLLFFWLLTLDRLAAAVSADPRLTRSVWPWVQVGLAWGGALLSKYHAVFLPAGMLLYVLIEPSARRWLARPGPYLAVIVGVLVFIPVLGWNAAHDWVSFRFQGGRAVGGAFRPETLLAALILPALYLFPWIWVRLIRILFGRGRAALAGEATASERFLLCQAAPPLATFLAVSCTRPILPHWMLVGFLPLFPMLGRVWAEEFAVDPKRMRRRLTVTACLPLLVVGLMYAQWRTGFLESGRPGRWGVLGVKVDPTADLAGWDAVASELRRRGMLDQPNSFLFTSNWYQSGQLAFATRGATVPVLCYHPWDARSFAFFSRPEEWIGHDGILVEIDEQPGSHERYERWFSGIEPLGSFEVRRGGGVLRRVSLYRCARQQVAFPFDDLGRGIRPRARGANRIATGGETSPPR